VLSGSELLWETQLRKGGVRPWSNYEDVLVLERRHFGRAWDLRWYSRERLMGWWQLREFHCADDQVKVDVPAVVKRFPNVMLRTRSNQLRENPCGLKGKAFIYHVMHICPLGEQNSCY
jgi:hypothetical protein